MIFLHPLQLLWALLALMVVAVLLFGRRRRVEVASQLLWQRALARRSRWRRMRKWLSPALLVSIVALLALVAAEPYWTSQWQRARTIAVVVDNSASMRATDVAPSRFDWARAEALKIIDSLEPRERAAVFAAGRPAHVLCGLTDDKVSLRRAIEFSKGPIQNIRSVAPTDAPDAMADALDTARWLLAAERNPQVIILSDGCFDGAKKVAAEQDTVLLTPFDPASPPARKPVNYAITRLSARTNSRAPSDSAATNSAADANVELLVELANFSDEPAKLPLTIEADGKPLAQREVALEPGRTQTVILPITLTSHSLVTAKLATTDLLPSDNEAYLTVDAPAPPRISVPTAVAAGTAWSELAAALKSIHGVRLINEVAAKLPNAGAQGESADISVYIGQIPEDLPPQPALIFAPTTDCQLWHYVATLPQATDITGVPDDALLHRTTQRFDFAAAAIDALVQLEFRQPPDAQFLAVDGRPVLSLWHRGPTGDARAGNGQLPSLSGRGQGRVDASEPIAPAASPLTLPSFQRGEGFRAPVLVVHVPLEKSDLLKRPSFAAFVEDAIFALLGREDRITLAKNTGEVIEVPVAKTERRFTGPDNRLLSVASGQSRVGPLALAGLWKIEQAASSTAGSLSVSLLDPRESDIRPPANLPAAASPVRRALPPPAVWFLAAALILGLVEWVAAESMRLRGRGLMRRLAATTCRALALAAIVLALIGIEQRRPTTEKFVVAVEDRSISVAGETSADGRPSEVRGPLAPDPQALVAAVRLDFAGGTDAAPSSRGAATPNESLGPLESDPARAVRRAAALVPPDRVGSLVLRTDGRQTRGELFAAAASASLPVEIEPAVAFESPEVAVVEVFAPLTAAPLTEFALDVVVSSNHEDEGTLKLSAVQKTLATRRVTLRRGINRFTFSGRLAAKEPRQNFFVNLEGFRDTIAANNAGHAIVTAASGPRVLLVGEPPESVAPAMAALESQGLSPSICALDVLPADAAGYNGVDAVLFAASPPAISEKQQQALEAFVRGGGGLIVIGGEKTFGQKQLAGTWLERVLPVSAMEQPQERARRLALVLVVDKSASMLEERRLDLAKEAARRTAQLEVIKPHDQVGVLAFGDQPQWISPLRPAGDKSELLRRIETLRAEGMTNMAPAMERARLALAQATADRRHVILMTDGVPSPGDFDRIAARMAAAGITVSTVSVGRGADQTILKDIARAGGGRHYHCDDPREMPQILEAETRSAAGSAADGGFRPLVYRRLPGLSLDDLPPITDFVATSPKPGAELLMLSPEGDPLVSWSTVGRGVVVAYAADMVAAMRRSSGPASGHDIATTLSRLVRLALPSREERFQIATRREEEKTTVVVDVRDPIGRFVTTAAGVLVVETGGARKLSESLALKQVAPGRYEASIAAEQVGLYKFVLDIEANDRSERLIQKFATSVTYPDEIRLGPIDESLLRDVARATGGRFAPQAPQEADGRLSERITPLAPWLAVVALVLSCAGTLAAGLRGARGQRAAHGGAPLGEGRLTHSQGPSRSLKVPAPVGTS